MSDVAHLCGIGTGQHSSKETSQRWLAVGDAVSDLTDWDLNPRSPALMAMSQQLSLPVSRWIIIHPVSVRFFLVTELILSAIALTPFLHLV